MSYVWPITDTTLISLNCFHKTFHHKRCKLHHLNLVYPHRWYVAWYHHRYLEKEVHSNLMTPMLNHIVSWVVYTFCEGLCFFHPLLPDLSLTKRILTDIFMKVLLSNFLINWSLHGDPWCFASKSSDSHIYVGDR